MVEKVRKFAFRFVWISVRLLTDKTLFHRRQRRFYIINFIKLERRNMKSLKATQSAYFIFLFFVGGGADLF